MSKGQPIAFGLTCRQVFPLSPLTGLLGFLGSRDHLVPDSGLRRLLRRHLEHERLEDMPLPLHTVAVDVVTGEELRLAGSAVDAVWPAERTRRSPARTLGRIAS